MSRTSKDRVQRPEARKRRRPLRDAEQSAQEHLPAPAGPPPELLAPAGHVEGFFAAVENGANAVYLGLKRLSARASATNFTLDELSHLLPFAHKRQVSVYVALNSLITAPELPETLDLLQALSDLRVDGVIVQDPGLFFLVPRFFPDLRLHASTLMTVQNRAGVSQLERMGARRVVLARELSVGEIEEIAAHTTVPLEVFVHGALCYSYSGMCLASSFRGGHSGLQGRCAQPCRLRFRQGKKEGFFLSCNDLCALHLIPRLKRLRIAAFKIEGRMKSADYIALVVRAYRHVMDARPGAEREAVAEAQEWLAQSPSRRLTSGFFEEEKRAEVLTPHRSGSSGLWVGSVESVHGNRVEVALRRDLQRGDRIRPESGEGKEKAAFTVAEIFSADGGSMERAQAGETVRISAAPGTCQAGERLFKVGARTGSPTIMWQRVRREVPEGLRYRGVFGARDKILKELPEADPNARKAEETLFLKIGLAQDLTRAFQSPASRVALSATRANLERVARQRFIPAQLKRFIWSLPPLISEQEVAYYRAAVAWYLDKGYLSWELNNWGHLDFFADADGASLMAGFRFNIRNAAAVSTLARAGCRWTVISLEVSSRELQHLSRGPLGAIPVVCVYGWPPLFTSRLIPNLLEEKPFFTPRKEAHFFRKSGGCSSIYADRPINWLDQLPAFRSWGLRHFMIDLSDGPSDQGKEIERLMSGYRRARADEPYSLFNLETLAPSRPERGREPTD